MTSIKPSELSSDNINPSGDNPQKKAQKQQVQEPELTQKQKLVKQINAELSDLYQNYKGTSEILYDGFWKVKIPIQIVERRKQLAQSIQQQRRCCPCIAKNQCRFPWCPMNTKEFCEYCRIGTCSPIEFAGMFCWYPGMVLAGILVTAFTPFICIGSFFCSLERDYVDPVCDCCICHSQSVCYKEQEYDRMSDEVLRVFEKYEKKFKSVK